MSNFDLIIIGGGAGAFAAAIRANELGAKTAMINAGLPLGGTCVNVGCVPSKTLLWTGELLQQAKHHNLPGVELSVRKLDFQKVINAELRLVRKMRQEKYERVLKNLSSVTLIKGRAKFVAEDAVAVSDKKLKAKKFIIAVGSTAKVPAIPGLKEAGFVTHIGALRLKTLPKSLAILGAGPVGLEFAQMYARFGTQVTILQRGDKILPHLEPALVSRLIEIFAKEGITVKTQVTVNQVKRKGQRKILSFSQGESDAPKELAVEEILLAVGKIPNTKNLGLEKTGVTVDKKGAIIVNKFFQTQQENIFAVGDVVNLPLRLETTAGREGTLASDNAINGPRHYMDYHTVPYTIFTDPQLAGVGLTEAEQMKRMKVCTCRTVSLADVPKAVIMRKTEGLVKMVVHPRTKEILGVHILSPQAGELIAQAMTLVKNKNTVAEVINSLPVFPTLAEALKVTALSFVKDISKLSCCI